MPFSSAAPIAVIATILGMTRTKGDATGENRRWEIVPDEMRKRKGAVPVAKGVSSGVQKRVDGVLERVLHFVSRAVF